MRYRFLLCLGVLLLAACASVPGTAPAGPPNESAWQSRRARLTELQDWDMQGRVGIVNGKDGGSGSMNWRQQGATLQFDFHGPFGAGALNIRGDADALHVRSSRGDDFITTDPERDFTRLLRVPLPVLSMRYWVIGLPAPGETFEKQVDAEGHLANLVQRGWHISYLSYAPFNGYDMPTRVLIQRDAVRIKLAIETWRVAGPASGRQAAAP
ncbi:MAG TPA: lipoprotein insertase outer membrane protein LolB [Gammaproteobacteria bacterium]|nr:lipoprotein insertase outer membrane protein LolB [Gammaproteobacteria bacterium]